MTLSKSIIESLSAHIGESLNPYELEYDSGNPDWIIKHMKDKNGFISLMPDEDKEEYMFVQKDGNKFTLHDNGKTKSISSSEYEKLVKDYALGIHVTK